MCTKTNDVSLTIVTFDPVDKLTKILLGVKVAGPQDVKMPN